MSAQYIRVFCIGENIPTVNELLSFAKSRGTSLEIGPNVEISPETSAWTHLYLLYSQAKASFPVELITPSNPNFAGELDDFITLISEETKETRGQKKVLQQLKATKYYISVPLPYDLDNDGLRALAGFLQYFTTFCGGMIQDDAEGFYEGRKVLLKFSWKS